MDKNRIEGARTGRMGNLPAKSATPSTCGA